MDKVTVKQKIDAIFVRQFRLSQSELVPTLSLEYDLFVDSLDMTEIIMGLEEQFDLVITDAQGKEMKTLGHVYNFVLYAIELKEQGLSDEKMSELLDKYLLEN